METHTTYESAEAFVRRLETATVPDRFTFFNPDEYAVLSKRTRRGVRLRLRVFGSRGKLFAPVVYLTLHEYPQHTEIRLRFGLGWLDGSFLFLWIGLLIATGLAAVTLRAPLLLVVCLLSLLMLFGLTRLSRWATALHREHLRRFVVVGLRAKASDEAESGPTNACS